MASNNTESTTTAKKRGRPPKTTTPVTTEGLFNLENLTLKDIKNNPIGTNEIRNAVETFYDFQDLRIISGNRKSAIKREANKNNEEVNPLYLEFIESRLKSTEATITKFLGDYVKNHPIGFGLLVFLVSDLFLQQHSLHILISRNVKLLDLFGLMQVLLEKVNLVRKVRKSHIILNSKLFVGRLDKALLK